MRRRALALLAAVTVVLGASAWLARARFVVSTGLVASDDPVVALDREVSEQFGLTRPVAFVIVARDGNVWTRDGLAKVAAVTREVLAMPGVAATDVVSLASPNMRDVRATESTLEPTYLMAEVPQAEADIAALRRRVDSDPNYGGQLMSRDGAAALVVANFLPDVPDATIASAALAIRARHDDGTARVLVTGAPVLARMVQDVVAGALAALVAAVLLGAIVLVWASGLCNAAAAACAATIALAWSLAVVVLWGKPTLPWAGYGLVTGMVLAASAALVHLSLRRAIVVAAPPVAAGIVLAAVLPAPGSALGIGLVIAAACALPAGALAGRVLGGSPVALAEPTARSVWLRRACVAAIALSAIAAVGLRESFSLAGYAERYLPTEARGAFAALRRHFPPPSTFVVRMRGAKGFVSDPAVLSAMDAVVGEMRGVPGVRSAQSLADIVKLVNRSFNDDDATFFAIPEDRATIARHLALAYSPGFRRFVDRGLSETAVWVYVDGDEPAMLDRVRVRLEDALRRQPLPGVTVDAVAGDGALVLTMARSGRRIAWGIALAAAGLALVAALSARVAALRTSLVSLSGALVALLAGAGAAVVLGLASDLVLLPILGCLVVIGGTLPLLAVDRAAARGLLALAGASAVAALPLALMPLGAAHVLVPLLLAPLASLAALVAIGEPVATSAEPSIQPASPAEPSRLRA